MTHIGIVGATTLKVKHALAMQPPVTVQGVTAEEKNRFTTTPASATTFLDHIINSYSDWQPRRTVV